MANAADALHIDEFGSGQPLLVIHGAAPGASGMGNFAQNVDTLSRRFRVLVADLPGYGKSAPLPSGEGDTYGRLGDLFAAEMARRGLSGVHVLGMATGAGVALAMASRHRDSVDKLVLVGPPGGRSLLSPAPSEGGKAMNAYFGGDGPSRERMRAYLELTVFDKSLITEQIVDGRYEESLRQYEAGVASPKATPGRILEYAASVTAESLIVWGLHNRIQSVTNGFEFLDALENSRLHVYRDAGLWVPFEKNDEFVGLVTEFLGRSPRVD